MHFIPVRFIYRQRIILFLLPQKYTLTHTEHKFSVLYLPVKIIASKIEVNRIFAI